MQVRGLYQSLSNEVIEMNTLVLKCSMQADASRLGQPSAQRWCLVFQSSTQVRRPLRWFYCCMQADTCMGRSQACSAVFRLATIKAVATFFGDFVCSAFKCKPTHAVD
jgi:hypothetical protein